MITEIFNAAFDSKSPNFYEAIMVLGTMLSGVYIITKQLIELVIGKRICKSTKLVITSGINQYMYWVKAKSESRKINSDTLKTWLIDQEGFAYVAEDYKLLKKFVKYLALNEVSEIKINQVIFEFWLNEYQNNVRWERDEWQ